MPGQAFRACALLWRAELPSTLLNLIQQFPKSIGFGSKIPLEKILWKALVNWGPLKRTWKWLDKPSVSFFVPSENVTVSSFLLIRGVTPDTTHQNLMVTNNAQYCLATFLPKPVRCEAKTSLPLTKALRAVFPHFLNVKIPSIYDKTAASVLISKAANVIYRSYYFFLVFFFKGGLLLSVPVLSH